MELLIVLMVLAVPVFGIWLVVKIVQWLVHAFSPEKATAKEGITCPGCNRTVDNTYEGSACPHCGVLIIPYHITKQLDELKETKKRFLYWHSLGKISAEEYNKLDKLYKDDREKLLKDVREGKGEPQSQTSSAPLSQVEPESPIISAGLEAMPKADSSPSPEANPAPVYSSPTQSEPAYNRVDDKQSSAFLAENNIKLMLYVGVTLFVLGAAIFVKNNWDLIPGTVKFASLLFITIATYLAGFFLVKAQKIPRTATTLIFLGSLLIPYNFYAVNNFALLGFKTDWRQIWLLSSIVCLPLYIFNCRFLKSRAFFYGSLAAYALIIHFSLSLLAIKPMAYPLIMTITCAIVPLFIIDYLRKKDLLTISTSIFDTHVFANAISLIAFVQLISLGAGRTNDIWTGVGYLVLCGFYMFDSIIIEDRKMLYASGISFYTAVLMFILYFNQPFLNVVAVLSTIVVLVELFFRYVPVAGREESFFEPFNTITQIIASVTAIGIFTMEISRFVATYFLDYNLTMSIVYQLRTMIWITTAGLMYFILLQMRQQKKIYSYIIIGYFYILGFIIMQIVMDVANHAFGFMAMGALALLVQKYLSQRHSNETLFGPLKSFSYIFTIIMGIYLVMRYVVSASSTGDYLLALMRTGGLLLYFSLAFYLYREKLMIYIISFLFYLASFIIVINIMGLDQHALFFSMATLPVFGLYWFCRDKEHANDLLTIQAVALAVSFGISLFKGFYIFPSFISAGGYYFYNVVSLCIILAITVIHEFTLNKRPLAYVSGALFYLIIFVLAYPFMSLKSVGIIMTGACLAGSGLALLLSKNDDLAELSEPLETVSNTVQIVVICAIFTALYIRSWQNVIAFQVMAYTVAAVIYGGLYILCEKDIYSYLAQLIIGLAYFSVLKYIPGAANYWAYHFLVLNLIYIGGGQFCTIFKENIETRSFRYLGLIAMLLSLLLSLNHPEYSYIIFSIYAVLCFTWGMWQQKPFWQSVSYNLLLVAYELMIYQLNVKTVEFYTVPLGLVLIGWGIAYQEQIEKKNTFFTLGTLVIYLPGLFVSASETWGLHGVFLGCISLVLLFVGIKLRSRIILSFSASVLILNGVIQSYSYLRTIPRWVYMASGGSLLIVMGMLFEMKRENLQLLGRDLAEKWRDWE